MPTRRSLAAATAGLAVLLATACSGGGGPGAPTGVEPPAATFGFTEGNRFSYCDPAPSIEAYPRLATRPDVLAHLYPAGGGRDYPVVDVHTHLATTAAEEVDVQRRATLHAAVDASWDAVSTAKLRAAYPAPNLIQFNLGAYLDGFSEDKLPAILAAFDDQRAAGAGGIKFFKGLGLEINDATGARLRIDDPRLAPLWHRAAVERWTISIHTGDPNSWMADKYPNTPYTKQDLVHQFIRVVEANPHTVFVAIHLLNLVDAEEELDELGEFLDRYPNLYADVAARSQYLQNRDQKHVRAFMIAHQDKLLFATDRAGQTVEQDVTGYEEEFKYWETSQMAKTYYQNANVRGIALPPDVLEKFYYKNALRAFCGNLR